MKKTIVLLAVSALLVALAPTAQAGTIVQTSSTDLNLTGRNVLAAVNFYDPGRIVEGQRTVGDIQNVDFDDFRTNVDDTGSPILLLAGPAGATLSTVINQGPGREYSSDPTALNLSGADATETENLVNAGMYFQDSETATLTFAFGATYATTVVEVQMFGAGQWNRNGDRVGKLVMSANSGVKGELVANDYATTAEYENISNILTFSATTDASGGLVIDIDNQNVDGSHGQRQYTLLSGTTVTVVPAPATMSLLAIGGMGLLLMRRRRRRRA